MESKLLEWNEEARNAQKDDRAQKRSSAYKWAIEIERGKEREKERPVARKKKT